MDSDNLEERELTLGGRGRGLAAALFGLVAVLAGVDLVTDVSEGASPAHWLVEAGLFLLSSFGLGVMARSLARARARAQALAAETEALEADLDSQRAESERWRREAREALEGLRAAIDREFDRWELSAAEREVALLLLKGLSHKEIASVRGTSAATSRQQARAVYRKGGLGGRNELAAYFLEDLWLPSDGRSIQG